MIDRIKEAKSSLQSASWTQNVCEEALDHMAEVAKIRSVSRNSSIFRFQDTIDGYMGMLSGQVRLTIPAETGDEFILMDLGAGMWFGSTALIENAPTVCGARALIDSEIVEIPWSVVTELGEKFPQIYKNLSVDQAFYTRLVFGLMASMVFFPLKARLANRLLMLIDLNGSRENASAYLETTITQGDFANLVRGSRQQVNRILRQWEDEGIVRFVDGQYHVPSYERLVVESKSTES